MLWFLLSLSSALLQSIRDLASKKILQILDEYFVVFADAFFTSLCLFPVVFLTGIPKIDHLFWLRFYLTVVYLS